ncbi:MAG: HAMP domain-containing histidine kinase [Cytophagales bacterium]|nr:HAMP domain-containing histidine kinase [Cytophagales bacterium]
MKLLEKHSRSVLVANLLIILLGSVLFYLLFSYLVNRNIRHTLEERKEFARKKLAQSDSLYFYQDFSANVFSVKRLTTPRIDAFSKEALLDTVIFDPVENEQTLFRQLTFEGVFRGTPYRVTVRRPIIAEVEILQGVLALTVLLTLLLVLALYYANRLVSKKLWRPFRDTLDGLRHYRIEETGSLPFPETDVTEFVELQGALRRLIERIRGDYFSLKEYTENTTHEIQTPLAIIRSKLELLQDQDLTVKQLQLVNAANQAVTRLSRLKEALVLLVRIKNRQYINPEPIPLDKLLAERLVHFHELMEMKMLRVDAQTDVPVTLLINPLLAEILLDNLISNAIKHNVSGGTLAVQLTHHHLVVRNTGEAPRQPTAAFFDRFVKSDPGSKSLGLGLAIVKAICETNGLEVGYTFTDGLHQVSITLPATGPLPNGLPLAVPRAQPKQRD